MNAYAMEFMPASLANPVLANQGAASPPYNLHNDETVNAAPQALIKGAKRAYATRRLDLRGAHRLVLPDRPPQAGDIVLCAVVEIGQHAHLELVTGRRARLFPGDTIIVAYGERYATDQFHARLPTDFSICSLAAAGGIAGEVVDKHDSMRKATRIRPLGLLEDRDGTVFNLAAGAVPALAVDPAARRPGVITVLGSSMNAGKTTTAANIIRSLVRQNLKVAAVKLTGTGSGGDCWLFEDSGADPVLDFTDAGFASTYNVPAAEIEAAGWRLLSVLFAAKPDFIVCEIADGIFQQETAALLRSAFLKEVTDSVIFAAGDPISAAAGAHLLASHGLAPAAISGLVSASPLAAEEAARATGLRVLTNADFDSGEALSAALLNVARVAGGRS